MKSIIKKILLEYVQGMDEIDHTTHSKDRIVDRIINPTEVKVRFNYHNGSKWLYDYVGTYIIPQEIKDKIISRIDTILNYDIAIDEQYAVILHHFKLDPSDVNFYDRELKYKVMKLYLDEYPQGYEPRFYLTVEDKEGKPSTGDYLIAILKTNNIVTIEYTNSVGMKSSKYDGSKIINVDDLNRFGVKKGF